MASEQFPSAACSPLEVETRFAIKRRFFYFAIYNHGWWIFKRASYGIYIYISSLLFLFPFFLPSFLPSLFPLPSFSFFSFLYYPVNPMNFQIRFQSSRGIYALLIRTLIEILWKLPCACIHIHLNKYYQPVVEKNFYRVEWNYRFRQFKIKEN